MPLYPGLGLPLRHEDISTKCYPIGAHRNNYCSSSEVLFVRELAMMDIMEKITDKPDWHKKVFDEAIVARWEQEALAIPDVELYKLAVAAKKQYWPDGNGNEIVLVDDRTEGRERKIKGIVDKTTFEFCVRELQCKARYFEETGIVPTLDAYASAAKSDTLISKELHGDLRHAFERLKTDQSAKPDWHPRSGEMVQNLVHPSMYPLVYGRSRVFKDECVGVTDAVHTWAGKGDVIVKDDTQPPPYCSWRSEVPPEYWSSTYQWLPANVAFQHDGGVRFTSYINNLHPDKYPDIYRSIEKLIQVSLPLWDQCLAIGTCYDYTEGAGRLATRIDLPASVDDNCPENWIPDCPENCAHLDITDEQLEEAGYHPDSYPEEDIPQFKWEALRVPRIPHPKWEDIDYAPVPDECLSQRFSQAGLQIIVKLASIELTPEKPEFPVGGWHIEGQMNEHIVGTALYYLDSENVTASSLSFRMQTDLDPVEDETYVVDQDSYTWMEKVFGTALGGEMSPRLQNYGTIQTRPGRLLAFPNVFQHRVSPFQLVDPTKPGHRRFIALWLVDPTRRIISTANVPPQQLDWYMDSLLGDTQQARKEALGRLPAEVVTLLQKNGVGAERDVVENSKLPAELFLMVRDYLEAEGKCTPMGSEEAKEHRERLMQERSAFVKTATIGWQQNAYSFCEH